MPDSAYELPKSAQVAPLLCLVFLSVLLWIGVLGKSGVTAEAVLAVHCVAEQ